MAWCRQTPSHNLTSVNQDPCRHTQSLGPNELKSHLPGANEIKPYTSGDFQECHAYYILNLAGHFFNQFVVFFTQKFLNFFWKFFKLLE